MVFVYLGYIGRDKFGKGGWIHGHGCTAIFEAEMSGFWIILPLGAQIEHCSVNSYLPSFGSTLGAWRPLALRPGKCNYLKKGPPHSPSIMSTLGLHPILYRERTEEKDHMC